MKSLCGILAAAALTVACSPKPSQELPPPTDINSGEIGFVHYAATSRGATKADKKEAKRILKGPLAFVDEGLPEPCSLLAGLDDKYDNGSPMFFCTQGAFVYFLERTPDGYRPRGPGFHDITPIPQGYTASIGGWSFALDAEGRMNPVDEARVSNSFHLYNDQGVISFPR